jgi:hypothetical protein
VDLRDNIWQQGGARRNAKKKEYPMEHVTVDMEKTLKELASFEKDQFPFAFAKTLTQLAVSSQEKIRRDMPSRFHLRNKWEQMGVRIEPARKADVRSSGSAEAVVKHLDAYMTKQEEGGEKKVSGKSLAIPMQGEAMRGPGGAIQKKFLPKTLLKDYKKDGAGPHGRRMIRKKKAKPFVLVSKNGNALIAIRRLDGRHPVKFLYAFAEEAHVKPKFDFKKTVDDHVSKNYSKVFEENMAAALRSKKGE